MATAAKISQWGELEEYPQNRGLFTHEHAEELAYRLWDEAGKPEGRDKEFYYRAEKMLREEL